VWRPFSIDLSDVLFRDGCRGAVEYVRKIGSSTPRTGYQDLVFKMRKLGSDWFIEAVSSSELVAARQ
jgi:hypothetical protein